MPDLTILHTNDFHNHFTSAQAERLAAERAALGDRGLLLDAGDAGSSGNITFKPAGEPILDLMNSASYDGMTVGNRDFHFSETGFRAKVGRAAFPVLCANLRARGDAALPVTASFSTMLAGAVRVTVFGLTVPMITERMVVRKVSSYVFDDPIETARNVVPSLREKCDLLICLSHIGLARDRQLCREVPGIDLVVGGHTHATLPEGELVGGTLIVQAGWYGKLLGRVTVPVSAGAPASAAAMSAELIPL